MKVNRIWMTVGVILIASAFYEARVKPQSRPLYERGLALYNQGNYQESQMELERAYQIEPNSTAIMVLIGWNHLKMRQFDAARENFSRAARIDPELVEAKLGLAYLALESGQGRVRLEEIRSLLSQEPGNKDFQLAAATALRQAGANRESAEIFRRLLGRGKYGELARKNLEEMYGLEKLGEEIPPGFPPLERPSQLQVNFRAAGQYLQRRRGSAWEDFYVKGVNIGPATPGHFASDPPVLAEDYLLWLDRIAALGANTVRLYTILPPAFYRALRLHNENPQRARLYLLQEVWLADSEETNLFLPAVEVVTRQEIARVIDLLHGQGDLPLRKGHASGLYSVDVSDYVLGLLIGREFDPPVVWKNNEANPNKKSYGGSYISIPEGNATEVWLASMMDYAASYETLKYNQQRPLAIVNWLPLDPLSHPTEAGTLQVIRIRERMGETGFATPSPGEGDDQVSVDDKRLRAGSGFLAGFFASYHVYPYYPNFLLREPALLQERDSIGPNSFFGYLKALKEHYSDMPLLISEYGIPTSIGVSHFHPYGWNHGGLTERQQGEILARMTQNIADAGCAGGIVFEWQDEWFKTNWLTAPLEIPLDRRPLWHNALNPEENFGLWTYESAQSRLFSPGRAAWEKVKPLYEKSSGVSAPVLPVLNDGADPQRTLRSLSVSSDEAFLYLRLEVQSLPRGRDGTLQLNRANYMVGISTRPGYFGSRILPGIVPHLRYPEGFNFLLHVGGVGKTKLLVDSNYNPYGLWPVGGGSNRVELGIRVPSKPAVEEWSPFEEMVVETNSLWFGRDGTAFPPQRYSRSPLRYGPLDPNDPQYDSLATWSADFQSNSLIFRLPWALLFVTDPSSRQVYAETVSPLQLHSMTTTGIALFAISFAPPASEPDWGRFPSLPLAATDSLPAIGADGTFAGTRMYTWTGWDTVKLSGRLKAGAAALQKSFRDVRGKR